MGSTQETRRSYRLRALHRMRNTSLIGREETPRTRRSRPRHRDTIPTQDRHRNRGHRLAVLTCVGILTLMIPAQAEAATRGDCPQHHAILKKYGLPPKIFGPIAWRESRCSWTSISAKRYTGHPDVGLLQIQGSWRTVTRRICQLKQNQNHIRALTRPDCQLRVAAYLWDAGRGAGHWRATSGKHG